MYVSGEIAGNTSPRSEPDMMPLLEIFMQIEHKFGERFDDTFSDEFRKLARIMRTQRVEETKQAMARIKRIQEMDRKWGAPPEHKSNPVSGKKSTLVKQPAPQHEPRHDIESVFWVMVCSLVRALPVGADDNPTERSNYIFNNILYHEIPFSMSNRRDEALKWTREEWEEALHPRLRMLAPMIVRMCELLCINWRGLSTPSNRVLLHQAFKRLLLMEIRAFGENNEDVQLNMEKPRTIYARKPHEVLTTLTDSHHRAFGCSSSQDIPINRVQRPKRRSDSIADPGETTSSRKRAKLDHSADPSPQLYDDLFSDSLSPSASNVDAPGKETGPFLAPKMEGSIQLGTEGTADDDREFYDRLTQKDVDDKAFEAIGSTAEAARESIERLRRRAESLVKMHLDDEAWHQVTVKPDLIK